MKQRWFGAAAILAASVLAQTAAQAQRVSENAVTSAEDAFGTSVGNETVGLYTSSSARGFNPGQAGNIRIEGLYFVLHYFLQGRVLPSNTVRVGLGAQSYPFPAPTGIVDYRIQRPKDHVSGSGSMTFGPYETFQMEAEVSSPIVPGKLNGFLTTTVIAKGKLDNQVSYQQITLGSVFNWKPSDNVDVLAFVHAPAVHTEVPMSFFTTGGVVPPEFDRRIFFGQPWSMRHRRVGDLGVVTSAIVFDDWLFRFGLFRSVNFVPIDHIALYRDIQPNNTATLDVVRVPMNREATNSGEARLSRSFDDGPRRHTFHLAVRGRDANFAFGGGSTVSFGRVAYGREDPRPEPVFPTPAPVSLNRVFQMTPGLSYVGRWRDLGEVSVGIQKSFYRGDVSVPGAATTRTESQPWLYNGTLAFNLGKDAILYSGYTRGLEESGIAPENATNRGQALPVSLTEQIDAGIRYRFAGLTAIAGVFEVKKPYFDRNALNLFAQVGSLSHRGVELSVSGQLAPGLSVVAGVMFLQAPTKASSNVAIFLGPNEAGRPNRNVRLNVQYGPPAWRGLMLDGQITNDGPLYTNRANTVRLPSNTVIDLGARYIFKAFGTSASVRVRWQNITDNYSWTVSTSGLYQPTPPRRFSVQLAADF